MTGDGEVGLSTGRNTDSDCRGEALRASEKAAIEASENLCRVGGRFGEGADSSYEQRNVQGGGEAFAGDVAEHRKNAASFDGQNLKKIAADLLGRVVDGFDMKTRDIWQFFGNEYLLDGAGRFKLGLCLCLVARDLVVPEKDKQANREQVGNGEDRFKVEADQAEVQRWKCKAGIVRLNDELNPK